jgi:hypothetical protein
MFMPDNYLPEGYDWLRNIKRDLDKDDISLYKKSLKEILVSRTFNDIKDSWNVNMEQGKNPICSVICGTGYSKILNHTKRIDFLKTDRSVEKVQHS